MIHFCTSHKRKCTHSVPERGNIDLCCTWATNVCTRCSIDSETEGRLRVTSWSQYQIVFSRQKQLVSLVKLPTVLSVHTKVSSGSLRICLLITPVKQPCSQISPFGNVFICTLYVHKEGGSVFSAVKSILFFGYFIAQGVSKSDTMF